MWRARGRGPRSSRGWWDASGSARYSSPRAQSWASPPLESYLGRGYQSPGRGKPYRYFIARGGTMGDTSIQSDSPELSSSPTVPQSETEQAEEIRHSREIEQRVLEPSREDVGGILGKRKLPPEFEETVDFSDEKQLKLDTEFTAQSQEGEQKMQHEGEPSSEGEPLSEAATGESGPQTQPQEKYKVRRSASLVLALHHQFWMTGLGMQSGVYFSLFKVFAKSIASCLIPVFFYIVCTCITLID